MSYDSFVEGAEEGFRHCMRHHSYLVAVSLVGMVFRAWGGNRLF